LVELRTGQRLEQVVAEVHVFERAQPTDACRQLLVLVVLHLQPTSEHLHSRAIHLPSNFVHHQVTERKTNKQKNYTVSQKKQDT